jgi:hypothetical protein
MRYTVYRIIVCSRTKIRMISSLRNFSVRILDADRFTIVVFQILDIKSNYLPGIVHGQPISAYDQTIESWTNYCSMAILLLHGKHLASLPYYCRIPILLFQHGQTIVA